MALLNKSAEGFNLGILFVHGIGSQSSGQTLVEWGDSLIKIISEASLRKVRSIAHHALKDEQGKAEMIVHLETDDAEEKWLITEGRWADAFLPPTYADLVSWSMRAIPWTLTLHTAQRYWRRCEGRKVGLRIYAAILAVGELLFALALAPLSMLLLLISLLLGMLPIPQLRSLILLAQGTLVSSVGDSLAFVESPTRAALIRTRLLERLHSLNQRCEKTIIIAHSQGAAVVLDALGGIPEPLFSEHSPYFKKLPDDLLMPDTLVTFGAGTNQLASLKVLGSGSFLRLGVNPSIYALLGFVGGLIICLYLRVIGIPYMDILYAGVFLLPGFILILLLKFPVTMFRNLYARIKRAKNPESLAIYTVVPIVPLIYVIMTFTTNIGKFPVFSMFLLTSCLLILILSIISILSTSIKAMISISRKPPGLRTWIDIYGSADPVSNGPTNISKDSPGPEVFKVWNFGAMLFDHTSYWQNKDGFALRIARICAATAGSEWIKHLPDDQEQLDLRSEYRAFWLRLIGRLVTVAWIIIGVFIWLKHRDSIPFFFNVPDWLKANYGGLVRFTVLVIGVAGILWFTYNIIRLLWLFWVRKEQKILLSHRVPKEDYQLVPFTGMIMVLGTVLILGYIIITKTTDEIFQIQVSFENLKEFVFIMGIYSLVMHRICVRIKRLPRNR